MSATLFDEMSVLSKELDGLKAEQARILHEIGSVQAKMLILAAKMTGASGPRAGDIRPSTEETSAAVVAFAAEEASLVRKMLNALRLKPGVDYGWLAEQVYGETTAKTRANVGSLMQFAKKQGYVQQVTPGRYIVQKKAEELESEH